MTDTKALREAAEEPDWVEVHNAFVRWMESYPPAVQPHLTVWNGWEAGYAAALAQNTPAKAGD